MIEAHMQGTTINVIGALPIHFRKMITFNQEVRQFIF